MYQITIIFTVEKQNPDLNLNILYKVGSFFSTRVSLKRFGIPN
jgi:hypothetical protein